MEKLKLVIGSAPSEIPYDDLVGKLMRERDRINQVLYSAKPVKRKQIPGPKKARQKRASKKITRQEAEEILRRLNL